MNRNTTSWSKTWAVAAAAMCLVLAGVVLAAEPPRRGDVTEIKAAVELNKQMFDRLIEKMLDVAAMVEKDDPQGAAAIRAAMKKAQAELITQNMDEVAKLLARSASGAGAKERDVRDALEEVLRILRDGPPKTDAGFLKAMVDRIDAAIGRQGELIELEAKDPKAAAQGQDDLTGRIGSIMKEMKAHGEKTGAPVPGQKDVGDAQEKSGQALKQLLRKDDPRETQGKVIKELEQAKTRILQGVDDPPPGDRIEKELEQLDEILSDILEAQKGLSGTTKDLEKQNLGRKSDDRRVVQQYAGVSGGEGKLADKVQKALDLLKDAPTVVFPTILGEVKEQLLDVKEKLSRQDSGLLTQATQAEIEQTLAEMIKAIRKSLAEHRDPKKPPQPPPPPPQPPVQPPPPPPPVSPIAELKLLQAMQLQINARTALLEKAASAGGLTKDASGAEYKKLADREKAVHEMAQEIQKGLPK